MRIWSLHPEYLDPKGLVALWRETLLAKKVLENNTKGYKNHPQLIRFKAASNPLKAINQYLSFIYEEAKLRDYNFDKDKIDWNFSLVKINVTEGQMQYEILHLKRKLTERDPQRLMNLEGVTIHPNPIFTIVPGEIEPWEIVF